MENTQPKMGTTLVVTEMLVPGNYPIGFSGTTLEVTEILSAGTYSLYWSGRAAAPIVAVSGKVT